MNQRFMMLSGIQPDELSYLENLTARLTEEQQNMFISMYSSKRKTTETILICTILGFVVVAGVQRFVLGQIGMGILYFFTGGLCLVGTIVDLINHKQMTFEFNQQQALETMAMVAR
jgi:TM2 domain-containing membrane protein YozV